MTERGDKRRSMARRRWLVLAGSAVPMAFAGCLGGDDDDDEDAPDDADDGPADDPANGGDGAPDVTLTGLTVGDTAHGQSHPLAVGTEHPITVTLDSATDSDRTALIDIAVYALEGPEEVPEPGDDDAIEAVVTDRTAVATDSQRVTAAPDSQQTVTVEGLTPELAGGPYLVVATVEAADTRVATPIDVQTTTTVDVDVYTVERDPENRPASGRLVLEADGRAMDPIEREVANLGETPTPTVEVPLDVPVDEVQLVARDVDDSLYPPGSVAVPVERNPDPVAIVAGYPFQGTDAMRYSYYLSFLKTDSTFPPYEEWVRYGQYGTNGDYNTYYSTGNKRRENLWSTSTDVDPPQTPDELETITDEQGLAGPRHSAGISDDAFFYASVNEEWEPADEPSGYRRSSDIIALDGLDAVTTPEEREFLRREEYRGRTVDVYSISVEFSGSVHPDSEVYIDPETGHALRVEREPMASDWEDSREVTEFFDHGEPETADIELMKERSTHETSDELDGLPWE